jgi:putative nucleotidyltransferase with HDIG domain
MPDHDSQVRDAFPELDHISDETLREKVVEAWRLGLERGGWRDIEDIPYAWNIHEVTNVEHVRGVTRIAEDAASEQRSFHGANPDVDVVLAAALLHDVGKCYEYVTFVDDEALLEPDPEYASEEIPHALSTPLLTKSAARWPFNARFRTSSAKSRPGRLRRNWSRAPTLRLRTPSLSP